MNRFHRHLLNAVLASGNGTAILTFSHIVQTGNSTLDLDYVNTNALILSGSNINDLGGLPAILNLPVPGGAGSLGANKNIAIVLISLSISSLESVRENHLAVSTVKISSDALAALAFSVTFASAQLEYVGQTQHSADVDGNGSFDNTGSAVNQDAVVQIYVDEFNPGLTSLIVEVDRGDGEVSIVKSINGAVVDLVFKAKIGATNPIVLDLDGISATNDRGQTILPAAEDGSIAIDTQQSLLDVDEDGSVSSNTDGRYIYRALLYKDFVGLVPIIPTSHRFPDFTFINSNEGGLNPDGSRPAENDIKLADEQLLANVFAADLLFDVDGNSFVEPGKDGIYIFRRLRGDILTAPAAHGIANGSAVEVAIDVAIDNLVAEVADTQVPVAGVGKLGTSLSSVFGTTNPLKIHFNESIRFAGTGTLLPYVPAALAVMIGNGPSTINTIDADRRVITVVPTANWQSGHTLTVDLTLIEDVAGNDGVGTVVFQ